MIQDNEIDRLYQIIESQKQTNQALIKRYKQLEIVFEEILVDRFVISELRDFYRQRAGTLVNKKSENTN